MTLVQILPWVLSCTTLATNWLAGNKWPYTYAVGLANQAVWIWWIYLSQNWGLIPLNAFLTIIYFRNHIRWTRDARIERARRVAEQGY